MDLNILNQEKTYQITIKYTQWPQNIQMAVNRPNGNKMCQHLPLLDPPKCTQIGIFGLKMCHLATLHGVNLNIHFWSAVALNH
jgi:hypothetical protein